MKLIRLDERKVNGINNFVSDVTSIPMIEAVYFVPYIDEKKNPDFVIFTLFNNSLYYNGKITGIEQMRDTADEYNELRDIIEKYNKLFLNSGLSFCCFDSGNYSLTLMHQREIVAETSLVSGTIIFDRFGDIEENQKRAINYLEVSSDLASITNIKDIIFNKEDIVQFTKKPGEVIKQDN